MTHNLSDPATYPRWSVFSLRDGERIERAVRTGEAPVCPRCSHALGARPESQFFAPRVILDATAHDLVCDSCRRIWCVVRHSPRSLRLVRMRRLAAAVDGADSDAATGLRNRRRNIVDRGTFSHFHAV